MSAESEFAKASAITGKSPEEFRSRASELGLTKAGEILAWLRAEFGLNYQQGGAVYYMLAHAEDAGASDDRRLSALFGGTKARWRPVYDRIAAVILGFGDDVQLQPTLSCVNARRAGVKFAILRPSSGRILEVGLRLADTAPSGRLESVDSRNAMASHRVRLSAPEQVDAELFAWLRQAYLLAGERRDAGSPQDHAGDLPAGLAAPARRALAAAGVTQLSQLSEMSEDQLSRLHGIGPAALVLIRSALAARGLSLAPDDNSETMETARNVTGR